MGKVLVIGDSCTDEFVYGDCKRMCPEAPVPIFKEKYRTTNGGMAKNVYANLSSIVNHGYVNMIPIIATQNEEITKTRYVDEHTNHMVLRIDSTESNITGVDTKDINFQEYDCVIISDYNKGFLTEDDIDFICNTSKVTFLDTKKQLDGWCNSSNFIKINRNEFELSRNYISKNLDILYNSLIVTMGIQGCTYKNEIFSVNAVDIKDLSGAGDTFLAALAANFMMSNDIREAIEFANRCATQVVQKKGVAIVNLEDMQ